jgi:hypothetical protein
MEETWKKIDVFPDYSISSIGRVRDDISNNIYNGSISSTTGYIRFGTSRYGKKKCIDIHRLVALAFIPNPNNKKYIDHIDRNKQNNCINNLRWVTQSENNYNTERSDNAKYIIKHRTGYRVALHINGFINQKYCKSYDDAVKYRELLLNQRRDIMGF